MARVQLDLAWSGGDTRPMEERQLIYDWNNAGGPDGHFDWTRARIDLNDETLRDGLQSPSVTDPSLEVKKRLLHLMADLGIVAADIGLPGAGPRVVEQVRALASEIRDQKLPIAPNCAARTVLADIEPIVRISDELGIKIEAATFIGSSPIRQYTEDWTLDRIVAATEEAVTFAVKHGLPVMYVTEDTTRARRGGARRERRNGSPHRQPEAAGRAQRGYSQAAGVLPPRRRSGRRADSRELSGGRSRRVSHRDWRACRRDHQGEEEGPQLARRSCL